MSDKSLNKVIGAEVLVDLPELNLSSVPAKIDTGADRSSIWASRVKVSGDKLSFVLFSQLSPLYTGEVIETDDFELSSIRNSSGHSQLRYTAKILIVIEGHRIRGTFTLADRSNNSFPILIGKRLLKKRFIVDVNRSDIPKDMKLKAKRVFRDKDEQGKPVVEKAQVSLNIAILSRGRGNYTTKRLIEEAKLRGHNPLVINHAECYVEIERDKPTVRYEGEDLTNIDVIIPRIGTSVTRYGSAIVRQFEMRGVYTTAKSIAIERSRNKLRSLQLLSKAGVGIPKTIFSRETDEVEDLIAQIGTPMIIKVASGTHGKGVVLAETRTAARSVIQAFYVEQVSILLQEYIAESSGSDIRAFVVGGRVVASMQRKSLTDDFRSNLHQGGEGSVVKLTEEEKQTAIKAARAMGLPVCGVDMIRSNRGPLVLEVNSSPGLRGIETYTGRNVAAKIIEYIELNSKKKPKKDRVGA